MLDLMLPIQEPFRIIQAIFIFGGLWVDSKLLWLLIYEIRYYKGAGEDYWYYGKEYVKNKFHEK